MSRASICKKNHSNRSYETQVTIKRSSNSNLLEIKKLKLSKNIFKLVLWTDEIMLKILALVSLNLDKRFRNCASLKNRDCSAKKINYN